MGLCRYRENEECMFKNPMYPVIGLILVATLAVLSAFATDFSSPEPASSAGYAETAPACCQ